MHALRANGKDAIHLLDTTGLIIEHYKLSELMMLLQCSIIIEARLAY